MYGLFVVEFLLVIAVLTLFGIADPNTYRTKLWQNGADHGFNSDPNIILYSYANYRPIRTPTVWNQSYVSRFARRMLPWRTNKLQHDDLQSGHFSAMHVHPACKSGAIHHAHLRPPSELLHPCPPDSSLCRLITQPVVARHE